MLQEIDASLMSQEQQLREAAADAKQREQRAMLQHRQQQQQEQDWEDRGQRELQPLRDITNRGAVKQPGNGITDRDCLDSITGRGSTGDSTGGTEGRSVKRRRIEGTDDDATDPQAGSNPRAVATAKRACGRKLSKDNQTKMVRCLRCTKTVPLFQADASRPT